MDTKKCGECQWYAENASSVVEQKNGKSNGLLLPSF